MALLTNPSIYVFYAMADMKSIPYSLISMLNINIIRITKRKVKVKGKAIPLQAWIGPEGSRRLRLSDFKTIGT
jgi:hypothetical protein